MKRRQGALVKPSRHIKKQTTLFLYTQAGGRCEFDGCNKYLLEHYPTETVGNFAEQAHIWAFSEGGPRGQETGRPLDINGLSNLMLLCKDCHDLVDKNSKSYPVEVLKKFKKEHEDRIFSLTGIAKNRDTVPLVLKSLISGRPMNISVEEMQAAVAPNYLKRREIVEIDLSSISDRPNSSFWGVAQDAIDRKVNRLHEAQFNSGQTFRVSIFALAPIPLLIHLGTRLSDKIHIDLYQRHRDTESWLWKEGAGDVVYITERILQGEQSGPVLLLVNLSGKNQLDSLPKELTENGTAYEITLEGQQCSPLFLNTRDDLARFTSEYHRALATIRQAHPEIKVIHLFSAVPAPIAITLGRARLPKIDPVFRVYDYDKRANGFVCALEAS
ncbi:hypothetical protein Lepto7375DRAFT_6789 [Leptolyngbya sp. PCC 7375]|nr:hypothetical protein Lepto7375DRAFT_6789 [Leptolyngbya sp. PCC 7375]